MRVRRHFLLTVAVSLLTAISCESLAAQTAPPPAFDIASIRINTTASDGHHHIYNLASESHFRTVNLSLRDLIQFAYNLPNSQILGGPAWLTSTMLDIDAKSDSTADAHLQALPLAEARQLKQLMAQSLLADRFQLKAHTETRQLPVFALVPAKNGPQFKPSDISGTTIDIGRDKMHIAGSDDTLSILARELAQKVGRVVLNQTGLRGRYDLSLRWTPEDAAPSSAPDAPPDIFTAIQEQLGLKLESTKGPVPVLVIDSVQMPSEN